MTTHDKLVYGGNFDVTPWKDALQEAKQIIGRFADGSDTSQATEAKTLWYVIDDMQQGVTK